MTTASTAVSAALCVLAVLPGDGRAGVKADAERAKKFWKALAGGDVETIKPFYAPKILLKAGSELLKPRWGVADDRSKDALVDRDDLLGGYTKMIDEIGREKWTGIFSKIGDDKIQVSTADKDDATGIKKGDTVLRVATGPGDDTLLFVLRNNAAGVLLVHLEATDY